jgi:hypothetical protein
MMRSTCKSKSATKSSSSLILFLFKGLKQKFRILSSGTVNCENVFKHSFKTDVFTFFSKMHSLSLHAFTNRLTIAPLMTALLISFSNEFSADNTLKENVNAYLNAVYEYTDWQLPLIILLSSLSDT